jgi:hypothetical protein
VRSSPHDFAGGSIMGNKKDNKKKENSKGINTAIIVAAIVFIVLVGYMASRSSEKADSQVQTANTVEQVSVSGLIETRPLLPPDMWRGRAAEAYRLAAEIPQVVDAQYCYCDCSKNPRFKHKTLLTCYTDDHGANCDICQNEVFMSYDLYKKGYSIPDIKAAVDKEFEKHRHNG